MGGLGSSSIIRTGTRYGLEVLHQDGKKVKTKSQNVSGANLSTFAEITEEKLVGGAFLPPPPLILNRVKEPSL